MAAAGANEGIADSFRSKIVSTANQWKLTKQVIKSNSRLKSAQILTTFLDTSYTKAIDSIIIPALFHAGY